MFQCIFCNLKTDGQCNRCGEAMCPDECGLYHEPQDCYVEDDNPFPVDY